MKRRKEKRNMKYKLVMTLVFFTGLLVLASTKTAYSVTTIPYGTLTLNTPFYSTSWPEVWDLTKGDLTLEYTIDQTHAGIPGVWDNVWTEVGLRGEGASNFNPGPFGIYQGGCGGWMASGVGDVTQSPGAQTIHDKFDLQASGGRGEVDYDLLDQAGPVQTPPIGSGDNYGIWFDRDSVDQWQAVSPGMVDGGTFNTQGIYHVIVYYHALDAGLGSMFATVNGIPTGFYWDPDGPGPLPVDWSFPPHYYPAGISFKGDMRHMQVFAGIWAPSNAYGYTVVTDLTVTGEPGVSDPLTPDFTYIFPQTPTTIQFTDATHGGMPPYTYSWNFGDGATSTDQNPTHEYASTGVYDVKLTVTPYRCTPKSVTKTVIIPGQVIPEVPFGTIMAFVSMFIVLAGFIGFKRFKPRLH
jgi:PKD repeat protein